MNFGSYLQTWLERIESIILWIIHWIQAGGFPRVLALIIAIAVIWWIWSKSRQHLFNTNMYD